MDPSLRLRHDIAMRRARDLHLDRRALRRQRESLVAELRAHGLDAASSRMERRAIAEHHEHIANAETGQFGQVPEDFAEQVRGG